MRSSNRLFLTGVLAAFAAFMAACGSGTESNSSNAGPGAKQTVGKTGGSLSYRITSPPKTLNYLMADDESSVLMTFILMGGRLITFDAEKQEHVAALAESWKLGDDGRTLTVTLRDGLKFSDGQPLTTADVAFTLAAVYDERTNSPVFRDSLLVGGKPIETKISDERRMDLLFPEKVGSVENYLENIAILPKHSLDAEFQAGKLAEAWKVTTDPAAVVTSGPFGVESVAAGERVVFKRNPNYWRSDDKGNRLPYLDKITLEVISDPNNAITRLSQGTLDIADRIRTTDFASLKGAPGPVQAHDVGPGLSTDHIWFNLNRTNKKGDALDKSPKFGWFSDKRFRRAISHAVDRKSITATTLQGLATPLFGFVPAGNRVWLDPNAPKTEYDLEKARQILVDAGFTVRDNGGKPELIDRNNTPVEFTLVVPAENEPRKLMAAVVQEDLAKLGIKMQIAPIDTQGVTERWSTSFDYDAILFGNSQTGFDPSGFASFLTSAGSVHQWQPKQKTPASEWEAKVDQLFAQQSQDTDRDARKRIFNEIQSIFANEMPIIPIASRHILTAANSRIGNYAPSNALPYSLWNADRLFIRE